MKEISNEERIRIIDHWNSKAVMVGVGMKFSFDISMGGMIKQDGYRFDVCVHNFGKYKDIPTIIMYIERITETIGVEYVYSQLRRVVIELKRKFGINEKYGLIIKACGDQLRDIYGINWIIKNSVHDHMVRFVKVIIPRNKIQHLEATFANIAHGALFIENALHVLDISELNTQECTDMFALFNASNIMDIVGLEHMNTSKVTRMDNMFFEFSCMEHIDLSKLDTSSVENMENMFYACSIRSIDMHGLDLSRLKHSSYMFARSKEVEDINLSGWDLRNVEHATNMFQNSYVIRLNLQDWKVDSSMRNENGYFGVAKHKLNKYRYKVGIGPEDILRQIGIDKCAKSTNDEIWIGAISK